MDNQEIVDLYQNAKWIVGSKGSYRYWFEYDDEWYNALCEQATNLMEVIEYLVSKGLIDASDLDLPSTSKDASSSEADDDVKESECAVSGNTDSKSGEATSEDRQPVESPSVTVFQVSFPEHWKTEGKYKDDVRTLVATAMTSAAQGTPISEEALETIFSWFTTTPKIPDLTDILRNDDTLRQEVRLTADMVLSMLDKIDGEGSAGASWHVLSLLNSISPTHKFVPECPDASSHESGDGRVL
jgi:hypothetical protein